MKEQDKRKQGKRDAEAMPIAQNNVSLVAVQEAFVGGRSRRKRSGGGRPKRGGSSEQGASAAVGASNAQMQEVMTANLLKVGSSGPEVVQLQESLEQSGFSPGGVDGVFGPKTEAAVKKLQASLGVAVDGIVGEETRGAMQGNASSGAGAQGQMGQGEAESGQGQEQEEKGGFLDGLLGLFSRSKEGEEQARGGGSTGGGGIELEEAGFTVPTGEFYASGMQDTALRTALTAFDTAWGKRQTTSTIFTLVDFTMSDDERRLWVVDLKSGEVICNEFVTHGYGSDGAGYNNQATDFSNESGSGKSSLGLMKAAEKRQSWGEGREGTAAMAVDGLESGFNSNVRSRAVIMHQATNKHGDYVSEGGVHGASAGCWALDPAVNAEVIGAIPTGSLMFNYFPDKKYLENSTYLKKQLNS